MPQDLLNFSTSNSISIESILENSVQLSLENFIATTFLCLLGLNPRNTLSDNPFFAIIFLNNSFSDKHSPASVHFSNLSPFGSTTQD